MGQMTLNLQLFLFVPWRPVGRAVKWREVCLCLVNSTSTPREIPVFSHEESRSVPTRRRNLMELTKFCTDFSEERGFLLHEQGNPAEPEPARYGAVACSPEPS
jgi:hypothetical protein